MKWRPSLSTKVFLTAFLNVALLGLVFLVFARIQFRLELGSFLLTPVRDRMLSVSRQIALEFPTVPRESWNQLLARYSATYPAQFFLFDANGQELAGAAEKLPQDVVKAIREDPFAHSGPAGERPPPAPELRPGFRRDPRYGPGPRQGRSPDSLVVVKSSGPTRYWTVVRIPVFTAGSAEPLHGNLVIQVPSLFLSPFFDPRPWAAVVLAVAFVSVLCWLPLIRGLTQSIGQLTRATGQIAEGRFEVQLSKQRGDELGQLSESINRMAQRLSGFVHGQKRFLGDIAHELCSPLARIQVALAILEQRAGEHESDYVVDLKAEVDHMSSLVNELLSFSKAQIRADINLVQVNVADTIGRVLEREGSDGVEIRNEVNQRVSVMAQPDYIYRSLANVVRNAVRYAGDAGPITVTAKNGDGVVAILVADNGPGVPASELDEIFKPFYRPEFARTRETGGTGLGLAIVKDCIEACGGTVACRNRSPKGFEVEMRLNAADPTSIAK